MKKHDNKEVLGHEGRPDDPIQYSTIDGVQHRPPFIEPTIATDTTIESTEHLDLSEHRPLHFPTQRPNEQVVLLLRRHWTVLARDIIQLVASLFVPPIIIALLYAFVNITVVPGSPLYALLVEGFSLYYLFSFLAYFHDFVDYHLDIWVVTDQRIVSIEQIGLFNRVVSELNIMKVQDVSSEIKGQVQTFLDYGQVHIQSAGEKQRFLFEQVPHPAEVAKVILQVHDRTSKLKELENVRQSEVYRQQIGAQYDQQVPQYTVPTQQPLNPPIQPQMPVQPQAPMPTPPSQQQPQIRIVPPPRPGEIPPQQVPPIHTRPPQQ